MFVCFVENQVFLKDKYFISLSLQHRIPWFCPDIWIIFEFQNGFFKIIQFFQCDFISEIFSNIQDDMISALRSPDMSAGVPSTCLPVTVRYLGDSPDG